jgi:hypothetical protein
MGSERCKRCDILAGDLNCVSTAGSYNLMIILGIPAKMDPDIYERKSHYGG